MNTVINFLGEILGYIMSFCYRLLGDYSVTLVVFTFITKIILLPVSIWVQKNSVKLVKMQPELYEIKAKYFGNGDAISEKQLALYKKNKYNPMLDFVPLILQLALLMGVVGAVYTPLDNILHIDSRYISTMTDEYIAATDSEMTSSIQIAVADAVSNVKFDTIWEGIPEDVLDEIRGFDMHFARIINLAEIPYKSGGILFAVPFLAALSSFLMCFVQSKINVLQSEQGKLSKYGTMAFSVFLSLYLGFFVPAGVGWYWIWGNLFSIPQMYLLNVVIKPRKFIDYDRLKKARAEFEKEQLYHKNVNVGLKRDPNHKTSKEHYRAFLKYGPKQLVFYSEKNGFYKYYKKVIEYIIAKTDIVIHYITSDINDAVFALQSEQFLVYYIDEMNLIPLMMKMDTDIMVMTTPDLDVYHLKRSYYRKDTEYIFFPHSVNSDNMALKKGAINNFDTIFSYGPLSNMEIKESERVYGLKKRTIVNFGSALVDDMIEQYGKMEHRENETKTILIAPSWQPDNIIDLCLDEMLGQLLGKGWSVTLRPHPQYVRHFRDKLEAIEEKYRGSNDFTLQLDFSDNKTVYMADMLISDWSSIALEYAYTTLKPVIMINTPMKVLNPDYEEINVVPIDIQSRAFIGETIDVDKLDTLADAVREVMSNGDKYRSRIEKYRSENFYNIGSSYIAGGNYIIKRLLEYSGQKQ